MTYETCLVHAGRDPERHAGTVNPPIYRASTFIYPTLEGFLTRHRLRYTGSSYGLYGTPTTFALADALTALSGGARTLLTSSGLSAVTQTLTAFLRQGDHLLVPDSVYGPTRAFCDQVLSRFGVQVSYYDPLVGVAIAQLFQPQTRVVYLESPGSLTFEVQDVPAIAAAARARGVVTILDNTWATPLHFRAFDHGVDVEIQAGTKYLAGHSDLLLGCITTRTEELYRVVRDGTATFGDHVAPDVCYEALRGLRTLGVRMRQHQQAALEVARWLAGRPEVARVLHPALPDHPQHELWRRDFRGASSLFSVVLRTGAERAVAAMVEGFRWFKLGASFGGFESLVLVSRPQDLRPLRTVRPWREEGVLLRFHVGLEAVEDLLADLEEGFRRLNAALAGRA